MFYTTITFQGLIGSGGYGQIYFAYDKNTQDTVAIKAEPTRRRGKVVRRMILEQRVLIRLQGLPHFPNIVGSGCELQTNFIVMQLLSVNLGDLRKQSPLRRLSKSTSGRVCMQVSTVFYIVSFNLCSSEFYSFRQSLLSVIFTMLDTFIVT